MTRRRFGEAARPSGARAEFAQPLPGPPGHSAAAHTVLWKRATSLGGTESLIEHRASIEGAGTPAPADLLRLSVGIEDADDLIRDMEQALLLAHR